MSGRPGHRRARGVRGLPRPPHDLSRLRGGRRVRGARRRPARAARADRGAHRGALDQVGRAGHGHAHRRPVLLRRADRRRGGVFGDEGADRPLHRVLAARLRARAPRRGARLPRRAARRGRGVALAVAVELRPAAACGAAQGRCVSALLEVRGVRKAFADFIAVAGVDLSLPPGGITAVIGPNGAGKTTLINLLTGKLVPDDGQVLLDGADVTRLPPSARVRAGMARTFQVTNIFPQLTAEQNVAVPLLAKAGRALVALSALDRMPDVQEGARRMLADVGLSDRATRPAAELSHGDRRLLEIALALATAPRLLLLDEPTAGMGSGERDRVLAEIRRLAEGGRLTILLVEHDMDVVFGMATRIVVLHQGKVLADGAPQQIREDARVREIYLGQPTGAAPVSPPARTASAALSGLRP